MYLQIIALFMYNNTHLHIFTSNILPNDADIELKPKVFIIKCILVIILTQLTIQLYVM
jgi:hypothetical protein